MFSTEKQLGIFLMCRLLTFFTILQFFGGISRHTLAEIHHTEKTFDISGYGDWQQSYHRMCPPSYRTTAAAYNSDCAIPASAGLCRPKMVWEGTLSQILSKEDHLGLIYLHFGGWHFGIVEWHRIPIGRDGWSHIAARTILTKYKYISRSLQEYVSLPAVLNCKSFIINPLPFNVNIFLNMSHAIIRKIYMAPTWLP